MPVFRRPVVILVLSYSVGVLASRWLIFRDLTLDGPTAATMITVPLVQAAALAAWRRLAARGARR
jgi:hypothetical protein